MWEAFRDRFWFAFAEDAERQSRLTSLERAWRTSDVTRQRELLSAHIDKVILLARPDGQPKHGRKGKRKLEIRWLAPEGAAVLLPGESQMKTCSRCRERKPLLEFNKNRGKALGRSAWCRTCNQTYERHERRRRPASVRGAEEKLSHQAEWRLFQAQWGRDLAAR